MKIVLAPDSFKESMSAMEAIAAMQRGIHDVMPQAQTVACPMADGGEGTCHTLTEALEGHLVDAAVQDGLGRLRTAQFGWVDHRQLALLEVAQACGIEHISPQERDVWKTSSHGVAELIRAALAHQPAQLILGLGGTATNDGGVGLLQELGAKIYLQGQNYPTGERLTPRHLTHISHVDLAPVRAALAGVEVLAASDVTNPLTGPHGATAVFGPQKGVRHEDVPELDAALLHWGKILEQASGRDILTTAGAGAAGGIGAALLAVGASLVPGVDLVMQQVGLAQKLEGADLILTGEGKIDSQTEQGKVLSGVLAVASAAGVPAIALGGVVETKNLAGWAGVYEITPPGQPLAEALEQGAVNLQHTTAQALAAFLKHP